MPYEANSCRHLSCYYCCQNGREEKCRGCGAPVAEWQSTLK